MDPWGIKLDQNLVLRVQTHLKLRLMSDAEERIRETMARWEWQAEVRALLATGRYTMTALIKEITVQVVTHLTPQGRQKRVPADSGRTADSKAEGGRL